MQPIDEKTASELKLSSLDGVYIYEVAKGGAADKAGVRKGDVLLAIDSTVVKGASAVQEKVNNYHPGDKAKLKLFRDGKEIVLDVVFQGETEATGTVAEDGSVKFYGASLKAGEKGVEITSAGNGKMAQAGAEDGYVIMYVNDQQVRKPQDVIDIAKKAKRSVTVEGLTPSGRPFFFAFGKEE